ncbi:MAG: DUF3955 domain-containing protein, partial [Lactobacillus amylovorus]
HLLWPLTIKQLTIQQRNMTLIGGFLMILGFVCFFIKANSVEYVDKQGFLHENFYLILVGYLFLFAGIIVLIAGGIVYLRNKHKH